MKKIKILAALLGLLACSSLAASKYRLWYDKPAEVWTEALPLGNGRLGAMVYGNPAVEHIQLNEGTIWAGQPNNNANPEAKANIPVIRKLIFEGKYEEAQNLANDKVMSSTNHGMPYQPFGDLYVSFPGHSQYKNYIRELSLDSARTIVKYTVGDVDYQRETITNFATQVITVRLTANKPGMITFNANFITPHQDTVIKTEGDNVVLDGVAGQHEGLKGKIRFEGRMAVRNIGGKVVCKDGIMSVNNADQAIIYVSIATNFVNYKDISADEKAKAKGYLDSAMSIDYQTAKNKHEGIFHKYMDRTSLYLGEDKFSNLTTDARIADFAKNNDNYLAATYFTFGRYLLICCSQPGGQPANLQGIWNDKMLPSWDSKYTTNINLEMNYWPAEVTNLTELNGPLFSLIDDVSKTGHDAARIMYGADGWVLHHNTDIWRITGAVDHAASGMWQTGAAWLCRHLWEHYLYTGDKDFLHKVYPIMKSAALFFDQTMVKEPKHGWLVVCPDLSPENVHAGGDHKETIAAGVTMDNELVSDLLHEVIASAEILNTDNELISHYKHLLTKMPPMQIGHWGQLQEWMEDWDDPTDTHRHISHLYGLYPSNQISPYRTPELFDAARTSLVHRGDESTGWSMGWKVCCWARLLDGNHAYKLISDQLKLSDDKFVAYGTNKKGGGTYANMFDAHPPFQIDGNFGCTAGIAEMLMQSYDGYIYLLPALPDVWNNGSVKGLVARGGFVIDVDWIDGRISHLRVYSANGGNCRLRCLEKLKGKGLKKAVGRNPNPLYDVPSNTALIVNKEAKLNKIKLPKTYLYDLKTKAGEVWEYND